MTSETEELTPVGRRETPRLPALLGPVELLRSSLRGGVAKLVSQFVNLVTRISFIAILARHIEPSDFGLFAMAIVFMGILDIIASSGLTQAIVRTEEISRDQLSKLFLYNILFALVISSACYLAAPAVGAFYQEPKIAVIIIALIPGFICTCLGSVPTAILQRDMRFVELAYIEVLSGLIGSGLGVGLALLGFGYWALVAAAVAWPATSTLASWALSAWVPNWPRRATRVLPMLGFAGTLMLNSLVAYGAYNMDKVLLGRVWGASALGIYGRASQLCTMSTGILSQATWPIAFSALSRLQADPAQLRSYFLNYYMLVNALTVPISLVFFFFAPDVIDTLLGPGWSEAHAVLRLIAPTVLILGMMNPPGPLMLATGRERRSLAISLVIAPVCLAAYAAGLPYGPTGVAGAYSIALTLWLVPHLLWCFYGTPIQLRDAFSAVAPAIIAGLFGSALASAARVHLFRFELPLANLVLVCVVMGTAYILAYSAMLFWTGKLGEVVAVARASG